MTKKAVRPVRYVGAATVADWIGVSGGTIAVYRKRYEGTDRPCPVPDVLIGDVREVPGWAPDRKEEWIAWEKSRVGQGVGGGPKPDPSREGARQYPERRLREQRERNRTHVGE